MESLLGLRVETVAVAAVVITALALTILVLLGIRSRLLLRLALRSPNRRRVQALLITLGLTLSTIIVTTALETGDAMSHTVRTLVASSLGRADEVVVALPRDTRRSPTDYIAALLNGSLLTGQGALFPQSQVDELERALSTDERVAGVLPAIADQVTLVNPEARTLVGQVNLLAIPTDAPAVFADLVGIDGRPLSLQSLGSDEALLSADLGAALQAGPGSRIELQTRDGAHQIVVKELAARSGLSGTRPTIVVQLAAYQHLTGRPGLINQVLIANRGELADSVRLSAAVAGAARVALADRAAADQLFALLARDNFRTEIRRAAAESEGRMQQKLALLSDSLTHDSASDDFVNLVTDPEVERRLFQIVFRTPVAGSLRQLPTVSSLRVLEIKQTSQDLADRWGSALTSTFLLLGLFSLATGALLVFLIFRTLADERRVELGITRALGARRRDLLLAFVLEGLLYDVVGSAVGLMVGMGVAVAITAVASASLSMHGVQLTTRLEPRSLVIAYCAGVLLTLSSVIFSSWRASRLSIVNAIRNLPEPERRRPLPVTLLLNLGPALAGPLLVWIGTAARLAIPQALGAALAILGVSLLARRGLERTGLPPTIRDQLAFSLAGAGLVAYWLLPAQFPLLSQLRPMAWSIDLFFLSGLSVVLGAVLLLAWNLDALTRPLLLATSEFRSLGLAVRTAIANPLHQRFRTGLVVAMFALVVFNMVLASVLLTATHYAYDDPEALAGGFDIRVELSDRTLDLPTELASARAVRADDFLNLGRLSSRPAQAIEPGPGARFWRSTGLQEIDHGFAAGLRAPLAARAIGFDSDSAVWSAVTDQAGYAVISGGLLGNGRAESGSTQLRLTSIERGQTRFPSLQLWVRDERGGKTIPVTIVGVLDARISLPAGIYLSSATLESAEVRPPQRSVYYLKSRPDAAPADLALALNISLAERGVRAVVQGEEVRQIQNVRTLLYELLQSFFAIGLLAGLAALGLVSLRAVAERRQQIGMLRAIGFRRRFVRLSFLLEVSLIAALGIAIGQVLGLAFARRLIDYLSVQNPEIFFTVPWSQILLIGGAAFVAALLCSSLPLWQIGRITPVEALRTD